MYITTEWLSTPPHKACEEQCKVFAEQWPDGCEITVETLTTARGMGLDVGWLVDRLCETYPSIAEAMREPNRVWAEAMREPNRVRDEAMREPNRVWVEAMREADRVRSEAMREPNRVWDEAMREANRVWDEAMREPNRVWAEAFVSAISASRPGGAR